MIDTAKLTERLDTLETRIAFQDQTIEELNDTITKQWQVIDSLTRKVALLEDHARTTASNIADPRHEPPPPHY
jgi:SlyX protein